MYDDGSNQNVGPTPPPEFNQYPESASTTGKAMLFNYWLKRHWKLLLIIIIAVLVVAQTVYQIVYPSSRFIPGTKVDGANIGGLKYAEAAKKLDEAYGKLPLEIYFGKNDAPFQTPTMSEVGIGVQNEERLQAISYPFYLRFVPGSIWWASSLSEPGEIKYVYDKNKIISYTLSKVGENCSIDPINATLKLGNGQTQLQLVPSKPGGVCDINELQGALEKVQPTTEKKNQVRVSINDTPAPITDDIARALAEKLNNRMRNPMPMAVDASTSDIPGRVVLGWLDFIADVPEDPQDINTNRQANLKFAVNKKRAEDYLNLNIAAKLIKKPGITYVSTIDFTEISRVTGASGRMIDMDRTVKSVEDYVNNRVQQATSATMVVGPKTEYKRSYNPTSVGFSALLAQYDIDNEGTYSAAFTELSGVAYPRSAQYRGNERMPAAGIHSLYLAYTNVMEEYAGNSRPVDRISGSIESAECFKLMLQRFDEGCRKGFYDHFRFATVNSYGNKLGLTNTSFSGEDTLTSANDLHKVILGLYKNEIAREEGGQKIISTSRQSLNNDGIPKGIDQTSVAHVIGEGNGVYNDTALVTGSKYGAFALTVMSSGEGTSWEKIAGLAKKIMDLKAVKVPKDAR